MSKIILAKQASAPDTPGSGKSVIYVNGNGELAVKDDAGNVTTVGRTAVLTAAGMKPAADGTAALQLQKANGTAVVAVDTTNGKVIVDGTLHGRFQASDALAHLGLDNNLVTISIGQGQTMTVTVGSGPIVTLLLINISGRAGLFVMGQVGSAMGLIQDSEAFYEQSSTPGTGKIGVWKSANSNIVNIKNNYGSSRVVSIVVLGGRISGYSAPA